MGKHRVHLRINAADRDILDFIQGVFGVSRSAAMRVAIRAAAEKLGFRKETGDLLEKKVP